jgi:hypothetical protein
MLRQTLAICVAIAAATGCQRHADRPRASRAGATASSGRAEDRVRHPGQGATEAGLDARTALVFVDGAPRAAFTYNELPSTLALGADHRARLCDYFAALGTDCARIRRVDFRSRGRVLSVAGSQLRRARTLSFHFSDGLAGKPRLDGTLVPGDLDDVIIWAYDRPGGLLRDDGRRGVRVNVDGRLVAKIKRNLLEGNVDPVAAPRPGEDARYRLADFLASRAVDFDRIRGIDLIVRGEEVVRLSAAEVAAGLEFTAPDRGHGEMVFHFGGRDVPALAVDLWANSDPPSRPMRAAAPSTATADRASALHAALAP